MFRCLKNIFQAEEGTAQADERDVLVTLVEAYENKHYDSGTGMFVRPMNCVRSSAVTSRCSVAKWMAAARSDELSVKGFASQASIQ